MSDRPNWAPDTWRRFEALYQPEYEDLDSYDRVLERIRGLPPLVMPAEVEELKQNRVVAHRGRLAAEVEAEPGGGRAWRGVCVTGRELCGDLCRLQFR